MGKSNSSPTKCKAMIDRIECTADTLTSRGGLSLFVRYLRNIALYPQLKTFFGSLRKSRKGYPVEEVFKQLFCFFLDGTSRHLTYFDHLAGDEGYAAAIESRPWEMVSSHAVKRFFGAFTPQRTYLFRHLLQRLFLWRLQVEKPDLIVLGIDAMFMDNDEAEVRHGVKPSHKGMKGFQPLQMTWRGYVIDAVFRGGNVHSNRGRTVEKMVRYVVGRIRRHYRRDVPIIIRMDSGFFDHKLFEVLEELEVGYISGGKLYEPIKGLAEQSLSVPSVWGRYEEGRQVWEYLEFGTRCHTWKRFRRAVFCRPLYEDRQQLLVFARPETVLITNLGMGHGIDSALTGAGYGELLKSDQMVAVYHGRGRDELVHRALKDFGFEQMPFKRFIPNAAFYYTMLVAFFLYEAFKSDVCAPVVDIACYATTLRRKVIDIAAKIVRHSGKIILKVAVSTFRALKLKELWQRSGDPPKYCWSPG